MPEEKKYNVLIIMTDEHCGTMTGYAGHPVVKTPSMDRLAKRGVWFENAYCTGPLCVPSRASLMTGQFIHRIKTWENSCTFSSENVTVAHIMRAAGYQAHAIGKMHFIGEDQLHGFNTHTCEYLPEVNRVEYKRLFQTDWNNHVPGYQASLTPANKPGPKIPSEPFVPYVRDGEVHKFYHADLAAHEEMTRFLQKFRPGSDSPFFCVLSYHLPHFPYKPKKRFYDMYKDCADEPCVPKHDAKFPEALRYWEGTGISDRKELMKKRAAYYGLITQIDAHIGNVMEMLEKNGLIEDTLIVYLSDHGEMAGERGIFGKSVFYENSVRVPLVFHCPSLFKGGRTIRENVSLVDILPTLQEFAGVEYGGPRDGLSLWQAITGKSRLPGKRPVFSDYYGYGTPSPGRMVRSGNFKLSFYHGFKDVELFDLEKDPCEKNNLADNPAYAAVRDELFSAATGDWDGEKISREVKANHAQRRLMATVEKQQNPVITKSF